VYEQDRLKKRTKPEVTWFFYAQAHGQIEWADRYLNSYEIITKVTNYYLSFIGDKNIIYDKFHTNEKYFHLLQMFIDNHHLPENPCEISRIYSRKSYNGCKPHLDDCNKQLKKIDRIIGSTRDPTTSYYTYTDRM
jgi:hypothetical protein